LSPNELVQGMVEGMAQIDLKISKLEELKARFKQSIADMNELFSSDPEVQEVLPPAVEVKKLRGKNVERTEVVRVHHKRGKGGG